jgi:phage-related protein
MATEIFTWAPKIESSGTVKFRVLKAQFGDGYAQTAPDGINNRSGSWPLTFTGTKDKMAVIQAFLDRHAGSRSFYWTPPLGQQSRFKASEYQPTEHGGGIFTIAVIFEEAFQA